MKARRLSLCATLFGLVLGLSACGAEAPAAYETGSASICSDSSELKITLVDAWGFPLNQADVHLSQNGGVHHLTRFSYPSQDGTGSDDLTWVEVAAPSLSEGPFELTVQIPGHYAETFSGDFSGNCGQPHELRFVLDQQ